MKRLAMSRRAWTGLTALAAAAASALAFAGLAQGAIINVSTTAQLQSAVSTAAAGDTIVLAGGNYAPTAPLDIKQNGLTLVGPTAAPAARVVGSNVVGPGGAPPDIFDIEAGAAATLRNLAITTADSSAGGAIAVLGTLTLENSDVEANSSLGVWGQPGSSLTVTNTTITGNLGGGIAIDGTASLFNDTIADNAGGIFNEGAIVNLTNVLVARNGSQPFSGDCPSFDGPVPTSIRSLASDGSCGVQLTSSNPRLGPPNHYGGPM